MTVVRRPDPVMRRQIEKNSRTASFMCWTCGSCDFECPVNTATGRLSPQKMVRLANLGFLDELLERPEIWYCLTCRRCLQICPNDVKPVVLIEHLRREAVRQHLVSVETLKKFKTLISRFQRVRWYTTAACLQDRAVDFSGRIWNDWLETPAPATDNVIDGKALFGATGVFSNTLAKLRAAACFTCGECSSACPVACERSVFDPRAIFRSANLGLMKDLFLTPNIWLCISCGRCTDACSQLVDGRNMIAAIQKLAFDSGAIDRGFPQRLEQAEKVIYTRLLKEIDALFGYHRPDPMETGAGATPSPAYA